MSDPKDEPVVVVDYASVERRLLSSVIESLSDTNTDIVGEYAKERGISRDLAKAELRGILYGINPKRK